MYDRSLTVWATVAFLPSRSLVNPTHRSLRSLLAERSFFKCACACVRVTRFIIDQATEATVFNTDKGCRGQKSDNGFTVGLRLGFGCVFSLLNGFGVLGVIQQVCVGCA